MYNFFTDIWQIISSLSFIDYILYFAVVTLIILIVSLIYVIETEKLEEKEGSKEEINKEYTMNKEVNEEIDLQNIVNTIDENPKPLVDMTAYEEEQENKAIISYDELLSEIKQNEINYTKEEMVDDVIPVKKISVNPVEERMPLELIAKEPKIEFETTSQEETKGKLFSYEKEEAFLKALQQLNELLN